MRRAIPRPVEGIIDTVADSNHVGDVAPRLAFRQSPPTPLLESQSRSDVSYRRIAHAYPFWNNPRRHSTSQETCVYRSELLPNQVRRLHEMLEELRGRNPFWTTRLTAAGLGKGAVESLAQWQTLPLLTKADLVADQTAHPRYGSNLTYPVTRYTRLHQTSGTTGRPMYWLDTQESWNWFMECWGQIYQHIGLRPEDIVAFPFSFGPFIGFWAAFEGAVRQGNLCLAMGGLSSETRLRQIVEHACTVVCCTPTYALRLAEVAKTEGIDLASSAVRALIVAGEPGGAVPGTRLRIEAEWGARVFDHWGMTDLGSLGIEPENNPGSLLVLETESIAEIIDPATGAPAAPGEIGELVMTNLGRWGQPVLRYRTGDLVKATLSLESGLLQLEGGVLGRSDDMLVIRGNNVFPSSVEAVLREFPEVTEFRLAVVTRQEMLQLQIEFEATPAISESREALDQLMARLTRKITDRLAFSPELIPVPSDSLPRSEFKRRRVLR